MGVNCSCNNNSLNTNELSVKNNEKFNNLGNFNLNYFYVQASLACSDPRVLKKLIRVQSRIRGLLFRKKYKSKSNQFTNFTSSITYISYKPVEKCQQIVNLN